MKSSDTLKNGVITFDEFCAAVGPVYEHSHVALRRAFNVFDADRNGSIDREELRTMLIKLKLLPTDHDVATFESMWKLADTNSDGNISLIFVFFSAQIEQMDFFYVKSVGREFFLSGVVSRILQKYWRAISSSSAKQI